MDISFVSTDPFNSEVIDSDTGNLLYDIETPFKLLRKRTTTVWTARKKVVGVYERNWGHNKVAYLGETRRVAEWLPKESQTSRSLMRLSGHEEKCDMLAVSQLEDVHRA